MARPPRKNVDYFPHPTTNGKKMTYIRDQYGNDGYTVWYMLLEQLGHADNHYLDLQDEIEVMLLCSLLKVDEEKLYLIINDLIKLKVFDKELWREKILYNYQFVSSISDAYSKRSNNILSKEELIQLLVDLGRLKPSLLPRKPSGNPQSKVKKSKEKETINRFDPVTLPEEQSKEPKPSKEPEIDMELVGKATKVIADFFGILEVQQSGSYMKIGQFVRFMAVNNQIDWLKEQFSAYQKIKKQKGFKHKWYNFTGTIENKFEDGAWNQVNWKAELKDLNTSKEEDSQVYVRPKRKKE